MEPYESFGDYVGREPGTALRKVTRLERAFLDHQLWRLRQLESRSRGIYAETLVQSALGPSAHASWSAACSWDICWNGITIAVRCSGQFNSETEWDKVETCLDATPRLGDWQPRWSFHRTSTWDDRASTMSTERRRAWTDAVVLAMHSGTTLAAGWSFLLVDGKTLDRDAPNSFGLSRALALAGVDEPVGLDDLKSQLADVAEQASKARKRRGLFPVRCEERRCPARA